MEYPKTNHFYFLIYKDTYYSFLHEIWQIRIISHLGGDSHGILGGTVSTKIPLDTPNFDYSKLMEDSRLSFYSDHPNAVNLKRLSSFLQMDFAPNEIGTHSIRIHAIDNSKNCLIDTWLILQHIDTPKVTKTFVVSLDSSSLSEDGKSVARRLPFENRYNTSKTYQMVSSDPSILKISSPMLQLTPQQIVENLPSFSFSFQCV